MAHSNKILSQNIQRYTLHVLSIAFKYVLIFQNLFCHISLEFGLRNRTTNHIRMCVGTLYGEISFEEVLRVIITSVKIEISVPRNVAKVISFVS